MHKLKFYTFFSILNILLVTFLIICIYLSTNLTFDLQSANNTKFWYGFLLYIIYMVIKIRLPKIFLDLADKYKDSLINKFIEFIHNNPQQKKLILLSAFCFDLPFILNYINKKYNYEILFWMCCGYFIIYAGGVLFFYIMLYREIDIKDGKVKTFF